MDTSEGARSAAVLTAGSQDGVSASVATPDETPQPSGAHSASTVTPRAAHNWERDPLNFYTEDAWCSRRLFAVERFTGAVVDPCAGTGRIVLAALEAELDARGSDIADRGLPHVAGRQDFLDGDPMPGAWPVDNIVSNPPYGPGPDGRLEERFLELALERSRRKVALFLPATWASGQKRIRWLTDLPLYRKYELSPRPACPPGRIVMAGEKVGGGTRDFAWFVFLHGYDGPPTLHFLDRDG